MHRIRRHPDVRAFLDRAEPWLLSAEERHGLVLGIAYQVLGAVHRYREPFFWATVEEDVDTEDAPIAGCVFRTPPHQVGVSELPIEAVEPLVSSLRETYLALPGVGGPERTATALAQAWTARFGGSWSIHQRQRLHALTNVTFPSKPATGRLRLALAPDVPVARAWMAGFIREAGMRYVSADSSERLIEEQRLYFWVDGEPRCMVGAVRDTPNTTGIGAVYTPPQFRGRGYASVAVATLSQRLLDNGRRGCFLYTDLANPTSTAIYQRVGYVPIDDVVDIAII
jgi:GNAT superfamily N-acetyltransferase